MHQYYFKDSQRMLSPLRKTRQELSPTNTNLYSSKSKSRITSRLTFSTNIKARNLDFSPWSRKQFNRKLLKLVNNTIKKKNKVTFFKKIWKGQRGKCRDWVCPSTRDKLLNSYRIDAPIQIILK